MPEPSQPTPALRGIAPPTAIRDTVRFSQAVAKRSAGVVAPPHGRGGVTAGADPVAASLGPPILRDVLQRSLWAVQSSRTPQLGQRIARRWDRAAQGMASAAHHAMSGWWLQAGPLRERERPELAMLLSRPAIPLTSWLGSAPDEPDFPEWDRVEAIPSMAAERPALAPPATAPAPVPLPARMRAPVRSPAPRVGAAASATPAVPHADASRLAAPASPEAVAEREPPRVAAAVIGDRPSAFAHRIAAGLLPAEPAPAQVQRAVDAKPPAAPVRSLARSVPPASPRDIRITRPVAAPHSEAKRPEPAMTPGLPPPDRRDAMQRPDTFVAPLAPGTHVAHVMSPAPEQSAEFAMPEPEARPLREAAAPSAEAPAAPARSAERPRETLRPVAPAAAEALTYPDPRVAVRGPVAEPAAGLIRTEPPLQTTEPLLIAHAIPRADRAEAPQTASEPSATPGPSLSAQAAIARPEPPRALKTELPRTSTPGLPQTPRAEPAVAAARTVAASAEIPAAQAPPRPLAQAAQAALQIAVHHQPSEITVAARPIRISSNEPISRARPAATGTTIGLPPSAAGLPSLGALPAARPASTTALEMLTLHGPAEARLGVHPEDGPVGAPGSPTQTLPPAPQRWEEPAALGFDAAPEIARWPVGPMPDDTSPPPATSRMLGRRAPAADLVEWLAARRSAAPSPQVPSGQATETTPWIAPAARPGARAIPGAPTVTHAMDMLPPSGRPESTAQRTRPAPPADRGAAWPAAEHFLSPPREDAVPPRPIDAFPVATGGAFGDRGVAEAHTPTTRPSPPPGRVPRIPAISMLPLISHAQAAPSAGSPADADYEAAAQTTARRLAPSVLAERAPSMPVASVARPGGGTIQPAIQRAPEGATEGAGPSGSEGGTPGEPKPGSAENDVNLLATEVWTHLKWRLQAEAQRRGAWG